MKKIIYALLLISSFLFPCFSYSSKKNIKDSDMIVLEGSVKCYGNEPFVYLGITTEDEAFYKIVASEKIIKELFSKQGENLKLYGIQLQNSDENQLLFEVKKIHNK